MHVDRVIDEPVRRNEMTRPGELVHVDITKPNVGYCYVPAALDANTRLAYPEALDDEAAATEPAFWNRAPPKSRLATSQARA